MTCRGYKGIVKSATATHVRMELEAQYKTVNIQRAHLSSGVAGPAAGGQCEVPAAQFCCCAGEAHCPCLHAPYALPPTSLLAQAAQSCLGNPLSLRLMQLVQLARSPAVHYLLPCLDKDTVL